MLYANFFVRIRVEKMIRIRVEKMIHDATQIIDFMLCANFFVRIRVEKMIHDATQIIDFMRGLSLLRCEKQIQRATDQERSRSRTEAPLVPRQLNRSDA